MPVQLFDDTLMANAAKRFTGACDGFRCRRFSYGFTKRRRKTPRWRCLCRGRGDRRRLKQRRDSTPGVGNISNQNEAGDSTDLGELAPVKEFVRLIGQRARVQSGRPALSHSEHIVTVAAGAGVIGKNLIDGSLTLSSHLLTVKMKREHS
jgi:hypothetical protein